jgi:hypothetical protein
MRGVIILSGIPTSFSASRWLFWQESGMLSTGTHPDTKYPEWVFLVDE